MVIKFYDREKELDFLEDVYKKIKTKSIMLVLYGRRRVGKTELIKKFSEGKKFLYIFIEPKPERELLNELEERSKDVLGVKPKFEDWDEFFTFIFRELEDGVLVFDEFQNLLKVNPLIFSKIQKLWDEHQSSSRVLFIVVGSYVGLMKKIFTDRKEPLFGRADFLFNLKPFTFFQTCKFLGRPIEECIQLYAIFGGIPKYLLYSFLYKEKPLRLAENLFVEEPAPLRDEGKHILVMEFGSEHKGYFSILEAIAAGKATQKEIVDRTGLNKDTVGKYLYELINIYGIIKRDYPLLKKKSPRFSRYFLMDNFYRFWFRFIYKNLSILESDPDGLIEIMREQMPTYIGVAYEDVARELLVEHSRSEKLPFKFSEIGKWWHREEEIDLVALNEKNKEIAFFEVKWRSLQKRDIERVLENLKMKASLVKWRNTTRKEHYGIVAKKINAKYKQRLREQGILAYDLTDIEDVLKKQTT
jgi:hypothetical protein